MRPSRLAWACCETSRWLSWMGSGMRTSVSRHANPNIMPWSPAPSRSTPCAMSWLCLLSATMTAQESESKRMSAEVYPISRIVPRTMSGMSTYVLVVTSPATTTRPVATRVSTATRECGSSASMASRMASEIWSQTLSGWPIETDSEVNRCGWLADMRAPWTGLLWVGPGG